MEAWETVYQGFPGEIYGRDGSFRVTTRGFI